mmetsp:Transcript_17495/g.55076  ORF Transcript_17495/g.55076 Transcript_17495/m.55076 type:complete len:205 (-) Transcript_17495:222-836(-)
MERRHIHELHAPSAEGARGGNVAILVGGHARILLPQRVLAPFQQGLERRPVDRVTAAATEANKFGHLRAKCEAPAATDNPKRRWLRAPQANRVVTKCTLHPHSVDPIILANNHEPLRSAGVALLQKPLLLANDARPVVWATVLHDEAGAGNGHGTVAGNREEAAAPHGARGPRLQLRRELLPILWEAGGHDPVENVRGVRLVHG